MPTKEPLMPKQATILIDMDGIVADLHSIWYARYNEVYGDDLTLDRVETWDTHLYAKAGKAIYSILEEPGLFLALPPIPGAIDGIRDLIKMGHRPVIVSAGGAGTSNTDKVTWIKKWMPWFDRRDIVLTHAKELVRGDILFDDSPHNAEAYAKAWPNAIVAGIEYPYNRDERHNFDMLFKDWQTPAYAWTDFCYWVKVYFHLPEEQT